MIKYINFTWATAVYVVHPFWAFIILTDLYYGMPLELTEKVVLVIFFLSGCIASLTNCIECLSKKPLLTINVE